mmetsp:Transcript_40568/g.111648  ORF Transcript_40568/g.111648 Transcript_40568/m.111648 type:complete len:369 (-) Transcript_40568:1155-2261(-)
MCGELTEIPDFTAQSRVMTYSPGPSSSSAPSSFAFCSPDSAAKCVEDDCAAVGASVACSTISGVARDNVSDAAVDAVSGVAVVAAMAVAVGASSVANLAFSASPDCSDSREPAGASRPLSMPTASSSLSETTTASSSTAMAHASPSLLPEALISSILAPVTATPSAGFLSLTLSPLPSLSATTNLPPSPLDTAKCASNCVLLIFSKPGPVSTSLSIRPPFALINAVMSLTCSASRQSVAAPSESSLSSFLGAGVEVDSVFSADARSTKRAPFWRMKNCPLGPWRRSKCGANCTFLSFFKSPSKVAASSSPPAFSTSDLISSICLASGDGSVSAVFSVFFSFSEACMAAILRLCISACCMNICCCAMAC